MVTVTNATRAFFSGLSKAQKSKDDHPGARLVIKRCQGKNGSGGCFAERLACKLSLFWYRPGGTPAGGFWPCLILCNARNLLQDFQQVNLPTFLLHLAPNCSATPVTSVH
jgi:hypothetical protein